MDLFSQQRLHAALDEAGYTVSHRTVRRWIEDENYKPDAAWERAIHEVVGITKDAPAEAGALTRIESMVRLIAAERGIPVDGMDDIYQRVLELEHARQRPDVLDPSGGQRAQDAPPSSKR